MRSNYADQGGVLVDLRAYIDEYTQQRGFKGLSCKASLIRDLISSQKSYALVQQEHYENSEYLAYNIKLSVRGYTRDKKTAISIYKHFLAFLQKKGITVDIQFPPIDSYNSFERLMFIAKYLQDERHKKSDIADLLWVSEQTINADIRKLLGEDDDPIQICGKAFSIDEVERSRGQVRFSSTAHPLFLTENLSQIIVTLKGLKTMAENPLYTEYAGLTAANIWEQLSDYAKMRVRFVLSKLLPEDLSWYESLRKDDECAFYTEVRCSHENNILDCIKNGKTFFVEYNGENGVCLYSQCRFVPQTYTGTSIDVDCSAGRVCLLLDRVIKTAYTAEDLL